jgi:transposase-like protein
MEKELLKKYIDEGLSIRKIAEKLSCSATTIRYYLNKFDLVSKWHQPNKFNVEVIRKLCEEKISISEILRELNLHVSNTNFLSIKRFTKKNNIILPKNGNKSGNKRFPKRTNSEIFCVNSPVSRGVVRKRLLEEGRGEKCELCTQGIEWNGRKISMILDHINGVPDDNRRENLRFICPNCDSTLDTFCGRNKRYK